MNEMRYANRLNAFEREAVYAAIQNRVMQPVVPNNEPAQQQQLINGEIQFAQVNGRHLQPHIVDRGLEGEQQQRLGPSHGVALQDHQPEELQQPLREDVQYEGLGGPQAQNEDEQQQNLAENDNEGPHGHLEAEAEQQVEHEEDEYDSLGNQAHAQQIPVPVSAAGERRPYHALARENAEALNRLLSREVPILTQQLQNTMELMNQLIRRQLDN